MGTVLDMFIVVDSANHLPMFINVVGAFSLLQNNMVRSMLL